MDAITYPDVTVDLAGHDGNAFAIIGRVQAAIRQAHGSEAAGKFAAEAMSQDSYDGLLQFVMRTVEVN